MPYVALEKKAKKKNKICSLKKAHKHKMADMFMNTKLGLRFDSMHCFFFAARVFSFKAFTLNSGITR